MKIKPHAAEQPIGHQRNQRKSHKNLQTNENQNMTFQNAQNAIKAILRGKFTVIRPTSSNKKNLI